MELNGTRRSMGRGYSITTSTFAVAEAPLQKQGVRPPPATRRDLEEFWRLELEQAIRRYKTTTAEYKEILEGCGDRAAEGSDGASALRRAREAQTQALADFTRMLRLFTDLTVHDRWPEEWPAVSADGVCRLSGV